MYNGLTSLLKSTQIMLLLFFCIVALVSCDKTTNLKTYSISGSVRTSNNEVLEDVTVLAFRKAPMNSTLSAFKQNYPMHGAEIDMYESFDHRIETPIVLASTNPEGYFLLDNLESNSYNLVAYKEGYGYSNLLNQNVGNSDFVVDFLLNPVINLPQVVTQDTSLLSDRVYMVSDDIIILPEAKLTIESNVVLLMSPNKKIDIYGDYSTSMESSLCIMSSDRLYSHSNQPDQIGKFDSITFYSPAYSTIHNIRAVNNLLGIRFINSQATNLCGSYIVSEYSALSVIGSSEFTLNQSSISGSIETIRAAAYFEKSNNITIEKCHFFNNRIAVQISGSANSLVRNNYFNSNSIYDFGFAEGGAGTVEYNTFRDSKTAIYNFRGQMYANYNDIQAVIGIHSLRVDAWFSAKYNNFDCTEYGIKSQCMYYNSPIVHLDCSRNYWHTTDLNTIEGLIYDRNDDSENDVNYHLLVTVIDYLPIANSPNTAGVY